jgi:hypothetical protein
MLQNIVEGSADGVTSMEMELKLLNVALENATHQIEKLQKENQQLKEYILQMQKKEEKA